MQGLMRRLQRAVVAASRFMAQGGGGLAAERDRWFLWAVVAFGAGIALYFALADEPPLLLALGCAAGASVLAFVWRAGLVATVVAGALLAVAAGFAAAKVRTLVADQPVLVRPLARADVKGTIEAVESRPDRGPRLTIRVREIKGLDPAATPRRIRVRLLARQTARPGDAIRLVASLAPPALPALPGDYDFARAAWFQGLGAVGYAVRRLEPDPGAPPPPFDLAVSARIEQLRQVIAERIRAVLPGETGALALALITGERGGITPATNEAYRASGIYHMLSISGLHMVIVAGAAFWVVRLALALVPGLAVRFPIRKIAAVVASVAAFAYLAISGAAPATARSWLMITIGFMAILADRPAIALRTVALSALLILAVYPETLFDAGFQMSYAAVVALVAAYEEFRARAPLAFFEAHPWFMGSVAFFGGIVLSTVIAGLATAPFSAFHFHQSQQYALLTNLAAIPLCNLVVMPAALAAMVAMPFGLEALPLRLMGWGLDLITAAAYIVARLPGALVGIPAIPTVAFALMVAGGLWLCLWRTRWRLLGIVAVAVGLAIAPFKTRPDVIAGADGRLVAVRGPDGALAAARLGRAAFELKRWREHDGHQTPTGKPALGGAFRCDAVGCIAEVKGYRIAAPHLPAALPDDCRLADVVVLGWPRPGFCRPRVALIDLFNIRDAGAHAIYLGAGAPVVETVQAVRGRRSWTGGAATRDGGRPSAQRTSRLSDFASDGLADDPVLLRPEVDDDEAAAEGRW